MSTNKDSTSQEKASGLKTIAIKIDGPLSKDVQKIEVDGLDITNMVTDLCIRSVAGCATVVTLDLIANVELQADRIESFIGKVGIRNRYNELLDDIPFDSLEKKN